MLRPVANADAFVARILAAGEVQDRALAAEPRPELKPHGSAERRATGFRKALPTVRLCLPDPTPDLSEHQRLVLLGLLRRGIQYPQALSLARRASTGGAA